MPNVQRFTNRRRAGLASHASMAALGPARALSSHARRIFYAKYSGEHRYPTLIFAFDAALLVVLASLGILVAWILLKPAPAPALALSLTASPLVAGAPAPFTARIRAIDGQAHGNVRLRWHLPPGAEIIRAEPAVSPDGAVYFGELAAGQEFISHLVIRLFQSAGTDWSLPVRYNPRSAHRPPAHPKTRHCSTLQNHKSWKCHPNNSPQEDSPESVPAHC